MNSVFIKFLTREHQVRGYYLLATRARVSSFRDDIYQVPIHALELLNAEGITYRRAPDAEVQAAHDQIRNPAPAVL